MLCRWYCKLVVVRDFGLVDYQRVWRAMQHFTDNRDNNTVDEIWLLEHPAVFTQGQAGKAEHILAPGNIPVIQVDRGGQVTYHGPGQLVAYLLIDLRRKNMAVRKLVTIIENAIVKVLALHQIKAAPRPDAPGVYVQSGRGAKIAQLGLRVRKGSSFHGLSLNVDMDMEPFQRINPCGFAGMEVTSMHLEMATPPTYGQLCAQLVDQLTTDLGYNDRQLINDGLLPGYSKPNK